MVDFSETKCGHCGTFNDIKQVCSCPNAQHAHEAMIDGPTMPTGVNTCVHGTHNSLTCEKCSAHLTQNLMTVPGYESLARILQKAYDQSAKGKGKERHAKDKPFDQQPIMEIARMVGVGGHSYQMCKKAQEATGMVDREHYDAAIAEFRGVIVYAAAAILLVEGMKADD